MDSEHYDLSAYPLFRSVLGGRPRVAKHKRCLVLDPSSASGCEARQHADTLWKYVIQPAVLDTDYEAFRATGETAAIDQQTIDALLDDDLVIAVLSFENPRVFYETALAQAAARPLVLMIEEGRPLPFDPRNAKVVTYRLDTESVVSAVTVTKLQEVIREIETRGAPACHGFRPGTTALGRGQATSLSFAERAANVLRERRIELIRSAQTRIDIMGVANLGLALDPATLEAMQAHAGGQIEIRVLQCAPANAGLISMLGPRKGDELAAVQRNIESAAEAWQRMVESHALNLPLTIRRAQSSFPMANALVTDQAVLARPYLRSRTAGARPILHALAGEAYHAAMCEDFNLLWSEAATVYRADPEARALRARTGNAALRAAAYWSQSSPETAAPEPEDDRLPDPGLDDASSLPSAANGNESPQPLHHALFGSPERTGASTGESPAEDLIRHRSPVPTVNARGHAIIRSVC